MASWDSVLVSADNILFRLALFLSSRDVPVWRVETDSGIAYAVCIVKGRACILPLVCPRGEGQLVMRWLVALDESDFSKKTDRERLASSASSPMCGRLRW